MARNSRVRIFRHRMMRGVGPAEPLGLAILDAALARLHGDVLDDGEVGVDHVGKALLARPDVAHHVHHRRRRRDVTSYSARLAR